MGDFIGGFETWGLEKWKKRGGFPRYVSNNVTHDIRPSCFPKLSSRVSEAKMDARVLDYIDDRLATSSDFEALDSLIENVKEQQDLLKRQVLNAQFASGTIVHVANE